MGEIGLILVGGSLISNQMNQMMFLNTEMIGVESLFCI